MGFLESLFETAEQRKKREQREKEQREQDEKERKKRLKALDQWYEDDEERAKSWDDYHKRNG